MAKLEIVFCKALFLNGCSSSFCFWNKSSSSCPAKVNTPARIVFFYNRNAFLSSIIIIVVFSYYYI
ncbi:hypothetical protein QUF88_27755 [Bacillus sp. DX1.1]|uniref:hypothetical protein n=1 Tax=unclassified Bacillus (in: firmicutes) TaxID=185979 RepID=UPI002570DD44|nr:MULTISPECIES: hypothetical protein [unclassified Bacillus (in: firmicutes)]MDM5157476.1 hypothetical protein [Bacillus sp. DX1.1]WJE84208.1 hypothetical protein QRE67_25295 [Bacillus sp. DX3.1]